MQILQHIPLEDLLFLDIETVSQHRDYSELQPEWQALWDNKAAQFTRELQEPAEVYDRASIYAEFGKIICICVGFIRKEEGVKKIRIKTYRDADEKTLLENFSALLNKRERGKPYILCAHNGKEFDFPYIARRLLIHDLPLPALLDNAGKKPWEIPHIDTMELWKFGDYKNFTSLNLLAHIFGIPTPKDDIDGSMVGPVYWKDNDLDRICVYCSKDVFTLAQVFLKFRGESMMTPDAFELV